MALWVVTLIALLASSVILNYNGVHGGRRSLSMKEDLELEKELKRLNKPAIKSIKTEHGEIYDCVDFYKQPAFDNPLLKNHKPEVNFSFPRETLKKASSRVDHFDIRLEGGECPLGTVPIRRTTKKDLIRWKSFSQNSENYHQFINEGPGKHFAGYQMKDENLKHLGVSAYLTVYNPSVSSTQYSGALIWAQNGQNRIQAGWHVVPQFYLDNRTHFFGYWTADGSQRTGCFNLICNGFIQVDNSRPLGAHFTKTSNKGTEDILETEIFLYKKPINGNWWVATGEKINEIGYWPKELFNSIREYAPVVGWRGETFAPLGNQSPQMGSGEYPTEYGLPDYKTTALFSDVRVYNESLIGVGPEDDSLEHVDDDTDCYWSRNFGYVDDVYRHTFFYGGPGENC